MSSAASPRSWPSLIDADCADTGATLNMWTQGPRPPLNPEPQP
jgi:hypothetical protein